jgi:hypothetical protein
MLRLTASLSSRRQKLLNKQPIDNAPPPDR